MEIDGKKAMVVGGASGMARATAESLAAKGRTVAILDLPTSAGEEVADGARRHVPPVRRHSTTTATEAAVDAAVEALGGLHIAVNTAGGGIGKRTLSKDGPHPLDDFRRIVELNLIAHVQPQPPAGLAHAQERARRRRARRDDQHRVDRRLRGPDRPGRLHRGQGRHRRHDADDGPRPRQPRHPRRGHRPEPVQHRHHRGHPRRVRRGRSPRTPRSRSAWVAPRSTPASPSPSSRTRCSTAAPSASTPASASPRSSPPGGSFSRGARAADRR